MIRILNDGHSISYRHRFFVRCFIAFRVKSSNIIKGLFNRISNYYDDLGAILIIAIFYSGDIRIKYLSIMIISFLLLLVLKKFNIKNFLPYLIVGIFLWDFTHNSGIHATIAGVLLAITIPHRKKEKDFSLLIKLEHAISPYVAFGIMPLFAFANAGVSLDGLSFTSLLDKVPLGIVLGLFLGKQFGVFLFSYASIKLKFAQMPSNLIGIIFMVLVY